MTSVGPTGRSNRDRSRPIVGDADDPARISWPRAHCGRPRRPYRPSFRTHGAVRDRTWEEAADDDVSEAERGSSRSGSGPHAVGVMPGHGEDEEPEPRSRSSSMRDATGLADDPTGRGAEPRHGLLRRYGASELQRPGVTAEDVEAIRALGLKAAFLQLEVPYQPGVHRRHRACMRMSSGSSWSRPRTSRTRSRPQPTSRTFCPLTRTSSSQACSTRRCGRASCSPPSTKASPSRCGARASKVGTSVPVRPLHHRLVRPSVRRGLRRRRIHKWYPDGAKVGVIRWSFNHPVVIGRDQGFLDKLDRTAISRSSPTCRWTTRTRHRKWRRR